MKTSRFALAACFLILHSSFLTSRLSAQRDDNRRLVWTGSGGMEWSADSWQTSGSYLAYANASSTSAVWLPATTPGDTSFLAGDIVIFDSTGDYNPSQDPAAVRAIDIASGGITASEVVLSGAGSFVFTGGAITIDAGSVRPGSVQISGTGSGMAATNVSAAGRLVKLNTGDLTLSNTAANVFKGGIHLAAGSLTIADNRALGDNDITLLFASTADASNIQLPAIVTNADGALLRAGTALLDPVTLRVPVSAAGLDITGSIYLNTGTLTLDIQGDTQISGRLYGAENIYGTTGGAFVKTGGGTLTITGSNNSFRGVSLVEEGRLVSTSPYAIGIGTISVASGAILEFRGVKGTMKQSFIGGGHIEITQGSDLAFNWHVGALYDYESLPNTEGQPANNSLGTITVTGASRFSAIASGTYSGVLGGGSSQVFIREGSTLVLGREGISSRGAVLPMSYPIYASRVSLTDASTLILNPNAFLNIGALDFSPDSRISFGASGVSQLRYLEGTTPDQFNYLLPEGMKLIVNELSVPDGYYREFVVVNQGANPLKDIAMTINAIDAAHDTLFDHLADDFVDPVTPRRPARGRKWTNASWIRYIVSEVDYDKVSIETPGVTGRISGAALGFDGILPGEYLVGLHAGAIENNLRTTNDTSLASKQRFLGIHAAQRFGRFHLAIAADTGRVRTDSLRNEPVNIVRGQWDTSYYSASVEAGASFSPWEKIIIKPYAGLRYDKLKISDYYERGPSPLLVEDFNDTAAQATYGLAAGRKFTLFKRDFAVDLTLARKHTVKAAREKLDTHYLDSPGTPVTLERGDYYSDITAAGIALRVTLGSLTHAGLAYDYETASTHTRFAITALVGCSW